MIRLLQRLHPTRALGNECEHLWLVVFVLVLGVRLLTFGHVHCRLAMLICLELLPCLVASCLVSGGRFAIGSNDPPALGAILDLLLLTPTCKAALEDSSLIRSTGCVSTGGMMSTTLAPFPPPLSPPLPFVCSTAVMKSSSWGSHHRRTVVQWRLIERSRCDLVCREP